MRFRISDLVLLVVVSALTLGLLSSLAPGRVSTGVVCFLGYLSVPLLLATRHPIGTVRCPYSDEWAVRPDRDEYPVVCDCCGSRLEREGRGGLRILSSPSDERRWALKFLPKLRKLRADLRPGGFAREKSLPWF